MLNFQLLSGDKYEGRCAEIYITEKQFLIYHCSVCEEIYATFNELLSHLTKEHYENIQEFKKTNVKTNVAITNDDAENQLPLKEGNLLKTSEANMVKTMVLEKQPDENVKDPKEISAINDLKEKEQLSATLNLSITSPQRKKPRFVTGMLKNSAAARTKLNSLTRFQHNPLEERKYVCGICGFAFKEKYNLRGHLLRHSNQKNFPCCVCPKKFFTKVELRLHEYRHKGERPYMCNDCGMGFVSNGSLAQHVKKHHNNKPPAVKCEHCDKTFPNCQQLNEHQLLHLEEGDVKCCESPKNLQTHMKLHGNKLNCCENCLTGFPTETALNPQQFKIESTKEVVIQRQEYKIDKKSDKKDDSLAEFVIEEGVLAVTENFDEYELVQTLTDLECNKSV